MSSFCISPDFSSECLLTESKNSSNNKNKIKKKTSSNKEYMKSFEVIWLTFMSVFVFILLIVLVALIVKIGTRVKSENEEDTYNFALSNNQQQHKQQNTQELEEPFRNIQILKKFHKFIKRSNKIDTEQRIFDKNQSTLRAFSIQEECRSYNIKRKESDTTSI